MKIKKLLLAACMLACATTAGAQPWPAHPVKLVVGLPPGGGGDIAARILAEQLSVRLGQPFVVENKPGAGGIIASQSVARSQADGYTILMITDFYAINAALDAEKLLQAPLPYDTFADFAPVGRIVNMQIMLMANPGLKATTLQEVVELAKKAPEELAAAHLGIASPHYVAMRLLQDRSHTEFLEIPYQGSGPATNALMAGEVKIAFTGVGAGVQLDQGKRARAIAVSGPRRDPLAPDVPTIAESGYPGFSILSWMGLLAPAATPRDIIDKLNHALNEALQDPGVIGKLRAAGLQVAPTTPAGFMDVIREDSKNIQAVFKSANIKRNR